MKRILLIILLTFVCHAQNPQYPWLTKDFSVSEKINDIPCLSGFNRVKPDSNSFAEWLQGLPLKNKSEKVRLFDERIKANQSAHYRIIDIDRGKKDLQQFTDAVIRLWSEYLYHLKEFEKIHFNFTNGDIAKFTDWIMGLRPQVKNNDVQWKNTGKPGRDYSNFRKYLETVFMYAGSYSLKKELVRVSDLNKIKIGDVFVQSGFPGHAVIVIDKCINSITNKIAILIAQSYMPAQDVHILINPNNENTNPWYIINKEEKLYTPEWTFEWSDLYRFK